MGRKRKRPIVEDPLTDQDIEDFKTKGFVLLRNAFPESVANKYRQFLWTRLRDKAGITSTDRTTWPERQGLAEIYKWKDVMTPKLRKAIDQLCGKDRWKHFGLGWWVINFPGHHYKPPWGPAGHWHVDGAHYYHKLDSKESGLLPIFLFSSIQQDEGGTALSVGSHRHVARILQEYSDTQGLKGSDLSKLALQRVTKQDKNHAEIYQIQGHAGDVMLTHPFLLHARSKNLGTRGVDSIRFMCNPNVSLHKKMRINSRSSKGIIDLSPVEQAIKDALV